MTPGLQSRKIEKQSIYIVTKSDLDVLVGLAPDRYSSTAAKGYTSPGLDG